MDPHNPLNHNYEGSWASSAARRSALRPPPLGPPSRSTGLPQPVSPLAREGQSFSLQEEGAQFTICALLRFLKEA
jgi:hypothetical protein